MTVSVVPGRPGGRAPGTGASPAAGGRNQERDFHGEKRSNETHASTTDPDARLFRKGRGKEARLCHIGHLLMENRHGLVVGARLTQATGKAERAAAAELVAALGGNRKITLGADKNDDTRGVVNALHEMKITPHVAQNHTNRESTIDGHIIRHPRYATNDTIRKRIEECLGWARTIGGLCKSRFIGREKLDFQFVMTFAAYNLIRMRNLGVVSC